MGKNKKEIGKEGMERATGERIGARERAEREKGRKMKKGGARKTGSVARRINN